MAVDGLALENGRDLRLPHLPMHGLPAAIQDHYVRDQGRLKEYESHDPQSVEPFFEIHTQQ